MSVARGEFHRSLAGISEAIQLEPLAQGATQNLLPPGIFVLRRGILIASLIALETFVRDRSSEALHTLERWPKSFEDLPEKLKIAARLDALSHLQDFAKLLRSQDGDYQSELKSELQKMASGHDTVQQFTKFVAGDFTGNLSDRGLKDLLSALQVKDCWASFRTFASDAGIGVPSVHELVKEIVRKRHRSAHAADFVPTATDISGLRSNLLCVAMCFDVAVSSSMEQAIVQCDDWANGNSDWRKGVHLYLVKPQNGRFRLTKHGRQKAIRLVDGVVEARRLITRAGPGEITVMVEHDSDGRPLRWDVL